MEITPRFRQWLRLGNALFLVLFIAIIGLVAWLSTIYKLQADWTAGNRNTLSRESQELLAAIDQPLEAVVFVPDDPTLRARYEEALAKYGRFESDFEVRFSNPDLEPELAQASGITRAGQVLISAGGRSEVVDDFSEQTMAAALQRLARNEERWAVFLQGHGERDPLDPANQGYQRLADALTRSGITVQPLNLIRDPQIPKNTSLLVIAAPQSALLKGEVDKLRKYVRGGGNLLWLRDPGEPHGLQSLAQALGLEFIDGVIVDANPELRLMLGISNAAMVPVVDYGEHPVTRDITAQTLFPFAGGLTTAADGGTVWNAEAILTTLARTWAETGSLGGEEVTFSEDDGDTAGPLTIGLALTRERQDVQQRVTVIGDSDFLANGYIGNGANLELGANLFNWLTRDDELIAINPKGAPDVQLSLSEIQIFVIAFFFLTVLPIGLLAAGVTIWLRRRRR
jgi:ABC-type uncharacterized transport system involved in gliding motility auxiliary subunit